MFLKQLDMLSPKITLYYKRKNKHASIISGILTLITFAGILGFILPFIIRFINRENPIAYFFNRYVDDIGTFSFKDLNRVLFSSTEELHTESIKHDSKS